MSADKAIAPDREPVRSAGTPAGYAALVELFSAIQGEGLNVGTRQLFVRFGGCDLRCRFCDSAHTWQAQATCRIEATPGQRDFEIYPNPVGVAQLMTWVERQSAGNLHDSLSLTGGEPLLHADFLADFLSQLRDRVQIPIYLETGGHRPDDLAKLLPYLALVGMDIKLPSVSGETHWEAHAAFLRMCDRSGVSVFCKLIASRDTTPVDLERAAELVARVNPNIPLFLQPVTPLSEKGQPAPPTPAQVLDWQAQMKRQLASVRVIPQTHKMLGQL
ncbi:7-carboxy-7-deazaguanine synthase QueE [Altericista sp. CCNU0014]|uniref:7-carboxy-7-deazaguanine synthase QueE n=1 Tax=Altericista sp. CCNU0014 TaxID=3082949 RepID=UPI00384EE31D